MGSTSPQSRSQARKGTSEITVFSLKVEKAKLARFREACEAEHRSMAQQLRHFIDHKVREHEANGEAA